MVHQVNAQLTTWCTSGRNCFINTSFEIAWQDWADSRLGKAIIEFYSLDYNESREGARSGMVYMGTTCLACTYMKSANAPSYNSSSPPSLNFSNGSSGSVIEISLEEMPKGIFPGVWYLCQCGLRANLDQTIPISMTLISGPYPSNQAGCVKGITSCDVVLVGFDLSPDDMVMLKADSGQTCGGKSLGNASKVSYLPGQEYLAEGSSDAPAVSVSIADTMGPPGTYELCWCRPSSSLWFTNALYSGLILNGYKEPNTTEVDWHSTGWLRQNMFESKRFNCTSAADFSVYAGALILKGPNRMRTTQYYLDRELDISPISGVGLSENDSARLKRSCEEQGHGAEPQAQFSLDDSSFQFSITPGFLAATYELCWCQPQPTAKVFCNVSEDFAVSFGTVELLCPDGHADLAGDGQCKFCGFFTEPAEPDRRRCSLITSRLVVAGVSILMMLTAAILIFRTVSRDGMRIIGRKIYVEDVSLDGGRLVLTTVKNHQLLAGRHSIPVILKGTGHFKLDEQKLRVKPIGRDTLELRDLNNEPLVERADTSHGVIIMSATRGFIHKNMDVPFPCPAALLATILYAIAFVLLPLWESLEVGDTMTGSVVLGWIEFDAIVTACALLVHCLVSRMRAPQVSSLQERVLKYEARLAKAPEACERGPSRGITAFQIIDFYTYFEASIRDRNMYYIDPNIVRPLTSQSKLSLAEHIGPQPVKWFISHWWGTAFRDTCSAIQKHALAYSPEKEEKEALSPSYWICTFANNQHRIPEELGKTHSESSFYLALTSKSCIGTCMILDERAVPLTRSWCLFELLQTMELEEQRGSEHHHGLVFGTTTGVLNKGAVTVELALQIGDRLSRMSLKDATASSARDQEMIHKLVLEEKQSFDVIDKELRDHVIEALETCNMKVDSDFDGMFDRLRPGHGRRAQPLNQITL
eukprot:TRINITY_DN12311_c0_g2_i1.p1 TRINITY_DN12311_c0_g2~~TRINITY_DN12311_c0_g2_i1.p1  ORF type:complete len:955 (-),score=130.35 TRINITY_DN12311_c0_g2_i1:54-2831(-)